MIRRTFLSLMLLFSTTNAHAETMQCPAQVVQLLNYLEIPSAKRIDLSSDITQFNQKDISVLVFNYKQNPSVTIQIGNMKDLEENRVGEPKNYGSKQYRIDYSGCSIESISFERVGAGNTATNRIRVDGQVCRNLKGNAPMQKVNEEYYRFFNPNDGLIWIKDWDMTRVACQWIAPLL